MTDEVFDEEPTGGGGSQVRLLIIGLLAAGSGRLRAAEHRIDPGHLARLRTQCPAVGRDHRLGRRRRTAGRSGGLDDAAPKASPGGLAPAQAAASVRRRATTTSKKPAAKSVTPICTRISLNDAPVNARSVPPPPPPVPPPVPESSGEPPAVPPPPSSPPPLAGVSEPREAWWSWWAGCRRPDRPSRLRTHHRPGAGRRGTAGS